MRKIWRPIANYEKTYACSNYGEVKRLAGWQCKKDRVLKPLVDTGGYLYVALYKNDKRTFYLIHRLVLETFVGPRPMGMECRHLDGNKQNNKLDNLCWGTPKENAQDTIKHGKHKQPDNKGEKCGTHILISKQVRIIKWLLKNSNLPASYIGKIFGVHPNTIYGIKHNKTWKHISWEFS